MRVTCPKCQTASEVPPSGGPCPSCGTALAPTPALPAEAGPAAPARLSRLAVASFICAFLICAPFINAGLALGLGVGALVAISNAKGALKGRGLAIAGIVLGCLSVFPAFGVILWGAIRVPKLISHARLNEVKAQVRSLAQAEFAYYQAHGQFVRVTPMPLNRPTFAVPPEPNEGLDTLHWRPPELTRYQFEVRVEGSGPESKALVTADSGLHGPGSPPPHEESLVTPTSVGEVTEIPSTLH
jgi:hypothetical protein